MYTYLITIIGGIIMEDSKNRLNLTKEDPIIGSFYISLMNLYTMINYNEFYKELLIIILDDLMILLDGLKND